MIRSLVALLALVPSLALAGERTLLLKTFEDAQKYPADLSACAKAGISWGPNVLLGASTWSLQTNAARGVVMNDSVRFLGAATGCGWLTNPAPFADKQNFLIQFQLEDGTYVASGQCDIISYAAKGVALAGCALKLIEAPPGVVGGFATSSSVLTFGTVEGFATGSVWTLHLYTND